MNIPTMKDTRAEIIILDEWVEMVWNARNKKKYTDLGYKYTQMGDVFFCHLDDLSSGSPASVLVQCPCCGNTRNARYDSVLRTGHTICKGCACIKDLAGLNFGRWEVIRLATDSEKQNKDKYWVCKCKCGTVSLVRGTSLTCGDSLSCGCYALELLSKRSSAMTGENSPHWNSSITEEERLARRDHPKNKKWRIAVYKQDNYTCRKCGKRGGDLEAHHLYSYSDYPEKQFDLDNGATLCKIPCHVDFHVNFMGGYRVECTQDDFERWLLNST